MTDDYAQVTVGQLLKLSGFDRTIAKVSKHVLDMPVPVSKLKLKDLVRAMEILRQEELKLAIEAMEEINRDRENRQK